MNLSAYHAALEHVAVRRMDRYGLFSFSGHDAAALLHHLTTNDIKGLAEGAGCDAALITNKGRLLDVVMVLRRAGDFLVVTSPNRRELLPDHARRFILFRQDVAITALENHAVWGFIGPDHDAAAARFQAGEEEVSTIATRRLPGGGTIVVLPREVAPPPATELDDETYNILRLEAKVPVAGLEITEDYNPWEAGLEAAISLHKGCYNGQEIIARLHTYQKVKQNLRLLQLPPGSALPASGTLLIHDGKTVGKITSSALSPRHGPLALGYVAAAVPGGTALQVDTTESASTAVIQSREA